MDGIGISRSFCLLCFHIEYFSMSKQKQINLLSYQEYGSQVSQLTNIVMCNIEKKK